MDNTTTPNTNPLAALQRLYAHSDAERFPAYYDTAKERPSSLYYADFKVAEAFGMDAVKDTLKNCGELEKLDPLMATELAVVANHLCWEHFEAKRTELSRFYCDIWERIREISRTWTEDMQTHFFECTD